MSNSRKGAKAERTGKKRKIIVYIATSADGFIARKDGAVDWLDRPRPKGNYGMAEFWKSIDTIVLGRKNYDMGVGITKQRKSHAAEFRVVMACIFFLAVPQTAWDRIS